MIPELYALAAQITALPGWEWRPGMRYLFAAGKLAGNGLHLQRPDCTGVSGPPEGCVPDLTDDATAGAMLGLVSPGHMFSAHRDEKKSQFRWDGARTYHYINGATLGEAIARTVVARGGWR